MDECRMIDGQCRWSRLSLLAAELRGSALHGDARISGITHDSRQVRADWIFGAIRGSRSDGHNYALDAIARGAGALMVDHLLDVDVPQLLVPSVREGIGPAASVLFGRPSSKLEIVGITGTNGKTTTAYLLEHVFETAGWKAGLMGTVETRLAGRGTPSVLTTPEAPDLQRSLARMVAANIKAVAMEVSSHALDQHRVDGTTFRVGVFTNLTGEHLDYHGTIEHYYYSKSKLFTPDRCESAVVCIDDEWGRRLAHQAQVPTITFGTTPGADANLRIVGSDLAGTRLVLNWHGDEISMKTPLVGRWNALNAAAAYLTAVSLGIPEAIAIRGIATCHRVAGRFETVDLGQDFLVVVDYAHTPESLAELLGTARELTAPGGAVHVVVGARGGRDRFKRPLIGRVAASSADHVIFTADSPGDENPAHIASEMLAGTLGLARPLPEVEPDRRAAIRMACLRARPGDVVMIVGRGHEVTQRVGDGVIPLDDRMVAADALREAGHSAPEGLERDQQARRIAG